MSAKARWFELLDAKVKAGKTREQATRELTREQPELREQMCREETERDELRRRAGAR